MQNGVSLPLCHTQYINRWVFPGGRGFVGGASCDSAALQKFLSEVSIVYARREERRPPGNNGAAIIVSKLVCRSCLVGVLLCFFDFFYYRYCLEKTKIPYGYKCCVPGCDNKKSKGFVMRNLPKNIEVSSYHYML